MQGLHLQAVAAAGGAISKARGELSYRFLFFLEAASLCYSLPTALQPLLSTTATASMYPQNSGPPSTHMPLIIYSHFLVPHATASTHRTQHMLACYAEHLRPPPPHTITTRTYRLAMLRCYSERTHACPHPPTHPPTCWPATLSAAPLSLAFLSASCQRWRRSDSSPPYTCCCAASDRACC